MLCQFVLYNQVNQSHICIYPLPLETPSSPTHHTLLWDMLLCSFQVYRKAVWLYMCVCVCVHTCACVYVFFFQIFSIIVYYKILIIVPVHAKWAEICYTANLVVYLVYVQQCTAVNSILPIYPYPPLLQVALVVKNSPANAGDMKRHGFDP